MQSRVLDARFIIQWKMYILEKSEKKNWLSNQLTKNNFNNKKTQRSEVGEIGKSQTFQ